MSSEKLQQWDQLYNMGSRYKLVIAAAKRALELSDGAPKLVETDPKRKPALVALQELVEGKVTFKPRKQAKE